MQMDPALFELAEAGRPNDIVRAIVKLHPGPAPPGLRVVSRFGDIVTCRLKRKKIASLRRRVVSMKAGKPVRALGLLGLERPKQQYSPLPNRMLSSDETLATAVRYRGGGTVLAVADWGIDFTAPDLRHPGSGKTRLIGIWDQRGRANKLSPAPFNYGRYLTRAMINMALKRRDPFKALKYHPGKYEKRAPTAHGTHVMGIAAANGGSGGPKGFASEADLLFINLAETASRGAGNLGDSVSILEAIAFARHVAAGRPLVINASVGAHGGPHDGSTLVELGIQNFLEEKPGRAICQSTGNYYAKQTHASGRVEQGRTHQLQFRISHGDKTPNEVEIWYAGKDSLKVRIRGPEGIRTPYIPLRGKANIVLRGRTVGRIYSRQKDPLNQGNLIELFLDADAPSGDWKIDLLGQNITDGRFDAWIERDSGERRNQSKFLERDTDPQITTGSICHAPSAITVGAFNHHNKGNPIASFSSSGPTREGMRKPDILAPGVNILSTRSTPLRGRPGKRRLARMAGSSMAAPYVAGAICAMFEAARRPLSIAETRRLIFSQPGSSSFTYGEPERSGFGYVNPVNAIKHAAKIRK